MGMTPEELDALKCLVSPAVVYGDGWRDLIEPHERVEFRPARKGEKFIDSAGWRLTAYTDHPDGMPRLVILPQKKRRVVFTEVTGDCIGQFAQSTNGGMYQPEQCAPLTPMFTRHEEEVEVSE